jgi:ADP-ribosyl-[dinitrogen reductase] hydrolase
MFGAVVGDIAGSTYENHNCKSEERIEIFARKSRCTDDSVLTIATAKHLLEKEDDEKETHHDNEGRLSSSGYTRAYQEMGRSYPRAGYGKIFKSWIFAPDPKPYGSWGNGSAMRASPIGWVATNLKWAMQEAKASAEVTHDHPEAVKGAQAVAASVFLARMGKSKEEIKKFLQDEPFEYDLNRMIIKDIRPDYKFDVSCQGSVPEAIITFLESENFGSSIRKAISLGGDSDTIACITGSIAHAFYGEIPDEMILYCRKVMDQKQIEIMDNFWEMYHSRWNIGEDERQEKKSKQDEVVGEDDSK